MAAPRQVIPGRFLFVTRRCALRQFFLRPDDATNQTVLYCFALAAQRTNISIVLPSVLSNHHHTTLWDPDGRYPEFTEHFHKLTARAMNALRGRHENFWASEPCSVVELIDRAAVMDKLVYAATNPVKDGLVDRVRHWPGVNGLADLLADREIVVRRPRHFFDPDGEMPETVTLRFVIPEALGDPAEFRAELRERVAAVEEAFAEQRARSGARVIGRRGVLAQSWRGRACSHTRRGGLRPLVASRDKWVRLEAIRRNLAFVAEYRETRKRWLAGADVVFPYGTYWLGRFTPVPVAPPPARPAGPFCPPAGGTALPAAAPAGN